MDYILVFSIFFYVSHKFRQAYSGKRIDYFPSDLTNNQILGLSLDKIIIVREFILKLIDIWQAWAWLTEYIVLLVLACEWVYTHLRFGKVPFLSQQEPLWSSLIELFYRIQGFID